VPQFLRRLRFSAQGEKRRAWQGICARRYSGRPEIGGEVTRSKVADMAKGNEFGTGDYVVYPTHGVGRVMGIENQEISGHSLKLIIIKFEKDRMTLRVPVGKAEISGLRKLSSRKMMDTALTTLKGRSRIKRTMWSRRAQEIGRAHV
jgi:CarD family transcriptional regulator